VTESIAVQAVGSVEADPRPRARLAPLPAAEWDDEDRKMFSGRLGVVDKYLTGRPDAPPMPNVLGVLVHHGRLASAWMAYNAVLLQESSLDPRLRELVVLRVAHRSRSRYEWLQHRRIGLQAGLTPEQLEAVAVGPDAPVWTDLERLLLTAADELLDHSVISDGSWAALERELDVRQLLEVPFIVGTYQCLAMVFNSVALEPDADMQDTED
jgi:4-carboxymuconolactone decarboxylase